MELIRHLSFIGSALAGKVVHWGDRGIGIGEIGGVGVAVPEADSGARSYPEGQVQAFSETMVQKAKRHKHRSKAENVMQ